MPRLVIKDYYAVIGVPRNATSNEIKRLFRSRIREVHPDLLGPDVTDEERAITEAFAKELTEAWDYLSDPAKKREIDEWLTLSEPVEPDWRTSDNFWRDFDRSHREPIMVPEPESHEFNGVWCWIEYQAHSWSTYLRATVHIPLAGLFKIGDIDDLPHDAHLEEVVAVDAKGDIVGRGYSLKWLCNEVRKLEAEARRNKDRRIWRELVAEFERQRDGLQTHHKPVDQLSHQINQLITYSRAPQSFWYLNAVEKSTVETLIAEIRKEIVRVSSVSATEILFDDLMAGRITHQHLTGNQALLRKLDTYTFRSGGGYTCPTSVDLAAHYRARLAGLTSYSEVRSTNLMLPDDEPTILELVAEGAIELAPDTIELPGNKGVASYRVTYGRAKIDGHMVPAGSITVSETVYNRLGAQYGRRSLFPTLPNGITLVIQVRVKVQDKELLTDARPDGKSLINEVKRCQGKLRNPRVEDDTPVSSFLVAWPF